MSRRRKAVSREINPDPLYNSDLLAKFINMVMIGGKKSRARSIVYNAVAKFSERLNLENALEGFEEALGNAKPSLEVKSRRIGGATYQVPVEIPPNRQIALVMRWVIKHSRSRPGKSMEDALMLELMDCFNKQGTTVKKKDDMHRMAEANKAFAHYKW